MSNISSHRLNGFSKIRKKIFMGAFAPLILLGGCKMTKNTNEDGQYPVKLITLAPGHFHAALVQKSMYPEVNPVVHVYAPEGPEIVAHQKLIEKYNTRAENPTQWQQEVYKGEDFLEKMLEEKKGNVVVLAGNNQKKTEYIKKSVDAGLNVLSDKPMAIDSKGFDLLKEAFASAEKNKVLLYDIMTERYEINSILQKEFSKQEKLFGQLEKGTPDNPAVVKESVHHFFKHVSGAPLIRPAWYYDVEQQADGLADVTTHLVDLIQWACFPGVALDYKKDVNMISAKRWTTAINQEQYKQSTNQETFPEYLKKDVKDGVLQVYSNGEMNYALKGIHAKVSVIWNYQAPEGTGDTHFSVMRGTKANVVIRQGKEQNFKPTLYVEPVAGNSDLESNLKAVIESFQKKYPGLSYKKSQNGFEILVPQEFHVGHEEHFAQVTKSYLEYLKAGKLPDWEVPNMLAKYYTTTQALEKAKNNK